uniref:Elongator complex protein 4 n=1 Tax=Ornithodoros turicata TaxID=34597 RepID=A0A2R5LN95_9ACAR
MASSFRKCGKSTVRNIPGARLSLQNTETVLSCGIEAVDYILGGGLPVGGIFVLEEDCFATYSKQVVKYFVAEGIVQNHKVYFASGEADPQKWLRELPRTQSCTTGAGVPSSSEGDRDLKIAFRYDSHPKQESLPAQDTIGRYFDFTERIELEKLAAAQVITYGPCQKSEKACQSHAGIMGAEYMSLLKDISSSLKDIKTPDGSITNVLRVSLNGLGSAAWGIPCQLPAFLYALKCIVREEPTTVLVTVPSHLAECYPSVSLQCRRIADIVLRLESFSDCTRSANPLFKNYHGLLHFAKISRTASHSYQMPGCDFLFHQRSKKFLIEKLHLPPDIGGSIDEKASERNVGPACGENTKFSF